MDNKPRISNFELLRLVAMFCIVFYHLILHYVVPEKGPDSIFCALQLPLHVGVPLFVFISGYFAIRPTLSGGGRLLLMTFVYCVPLQFGFDAYNGAGYKDLLKDLMFLSYGPYWFMRTYLLFYLFVPIVNKFLESADKRTTINLLIALAVINFWFGALAKGDASLGDGKNIVNFTFMYVLGNTFKCYRHLWQNIKISRILISVIVLNVAIVGIYFSVHNDMIRKAMMRIAFGYNSPFLILNASLLFMCFGKLNFKSQIVNYISVSILAVYLITEQVVVRDHLLNHISDWLLMTFSSNTGLLIGLTILSFLLMASCIIIDKLLSPLWRVTKHIKCFSYIKNDI